MLSISASYSLTLFDIDEDAFPRQPPKYTVCLAQSYCNFPFTATVIFDSTAQVAELIAIRQILCTYVNL